MTTTRAVPLFVLALGLATALSAQVATAHPQESTQNAGGPSAPFGDFFGLNAEARTQILVPRNELPATPAQLVGIEVRGLLASPMVYSSLRIDVAETNATQLQPVFANNLPTAPTTVLPAGPLTLPLTPASWSAIVFPTPHAFSGRTALVIDIRKVVNPAASVLVQGTTSPGNPLRLDRPFMEIATGPAGSGAANAAAATAGASPPIQFRLLWSDAPTLRNLCDATTATGNTYALGGQVQLSLQHTPGSPWTLAIDGGFLAAPVTVRGFDGELRLGAPLLFASGLLDPQGLGIVTVPLPTSAAFVGLYYAYQGLVVDAVSGAFEFTNGTDHFVNP